MKKVYLPGLLWDLAPRLCSAPLLLRAGTSPHRIWDAQPGHRLGCALVVSQTTKGSETCGGNPLCSTTEMSQSYHRERKKIQMIMALRQAEAIPLGAEPCSSHLSSQLGCSSQHSQPHWQTELNSETGSHFLCNTLGLCCFKEDFVAAPTLHTA